MGLCVRVHIKFVGIVEKTVCTAGRLAGQNRNSSPSFASGTLALQTQTCLPLSLLTNLTCTLCVCGFRQKDNEIIRSSKKLGGFEINIWRWRIAPESFLLAAHGFERNEPVCELPSHLPAQGLQWSLTKGGRIQ